MAKGLDVVLDGFRFSRGRTGRIRVVFCSAARLHDGMDFEPTAELVPGARGLVCTGTYNR